MMRFEKIKLKSFGIDSITKLGNFKFADIRALQKSNYQEKNLNT